MSTLSIELPDALTAELEAAVEAGWFASEAGVVRAAALGHTGRATCLQILRDLEQRASLWMSAKAKAAARNALSQIFGTAWVRDGRGRGLIG